MPKAIDFADLPKILYLTMDDVKTVGLSDEEIFNCVSEIFIQHCQGRVDAQPEQTLCTSPESSFQASIGWMDKVDVAGMRWSSKCENNWRQGLHRAFGMIVLNNAGNGLPYVFMDSLYITLKRIAATTAVSAKYLARQDSKVLGLIGAGAQGRDDLRMLQLVLPMLDRVKIYDSRPGAADSFVRTMADEFRGEIIPCSTIEQVVKDVDVVLNGAAVLKSPGCQVKDCWLPRQGLFIAPLVPLALYELSTVRRMDKITTDNLPKLISLMGSGHLPYGLPVIHAQQGEINNGQKAGREREDENVMALNLGLAVLDLYIGRKVYDVAREKGIGTWMEPLTW